MKEICIPKLENFLPLEQGKIQLGELPLQAELGPWRKVESQDTPHPLHIISTIIEGEELIPTRLYGPGEKAVTSFETPSIEGIEIAVAAFGAHKSTPLLTSSLS